MKRFESMTVLITGAATGIGAACALRFAEEGADIISVDINETDNEKTLSECESRFGVRTRSCIRDVRDENGARETVPEAAADFGSIDVLVCSAGIYAGGAIPDVTMEMWRKVLDINLTGTFLYNQAVIPVMMKQKAGSIINISSMAGKISWPASAEYSSSKSGVIGLTRSVAMELAPCGATANTLCPGNTLTEMVRNVSKVVGKREGMTGEEWLAMRAGDCPMKRLAEPREIAGIVAFLASEDSRYITGQAISADGGMVLS